MNIGIIGAGGWGTALSILMARKGFRVDLWSRDPEVVAEILEERTNQAFLPGVAIPRGVHPTLEMQEVIRNNSLLLLPVPSQHLREVARAARPYITPRHVIVHCSKGIETETLLRMSQVLEEELPSCQGGRILVLSGPSHAEEVARGIPTAIVVAGRDKALCEAVQDMLMAPEFRVYISPDVIGVELGGALKNIIALAAGISDGLGFGDNTKAALMTRGIAEIARLGTKMGADPLTFSGLAGIGDLIVTCTSVHSRNRRAGIEIGRGKPISEVMASTKMVIEGIPTTLAGKRLADKYGVEMPITQKLYSVLFGGLNPKDAVTELMARGKKEEIPFPPGW